MCVVVQRDWISILHINKMGKEKPVGREGAREEKGERERERGERERGERE